MIIVQKCNSVFSLHITELSKTQSSLCQKRRLQLSPEHCSDFYADQHGKPIFPYLTAFMSSGPIVVLTLARDDAVAHWKSIIGPANITEAKESHPEWQASDISVCIIHLHCCLYYRKQVIQLICLQLNVLLRLSLSAVPSSGVTMMSPPPPSHSVLSSSTSSDCDYRFCSDQTSYSKNQREKNRSHRLSFFYSYK